MKEITVDKKKLEETLRANMKIHISEFEETHKVYSKMAKKAVEQLRGKLELETKGVDLYINLDEPKSNEKDYLTALEMLDLEVNTNVTISEQEFKQYIKDEWSWSGRFAVSKSSYGV